MNLTENKIGFKRGQDPKEALELGMTPSLWLEDTIKKLEKAGIEVGQSSASDTEFVISLPIRFTGSSWCEIAYNKKWKPGNWKFRGHSIPLKQNNYNQKELLKIVYKFFEDFYRTEIDRMQEAIKDYEIREIKSKKAIENSDK